MLLIQTALDQHVGHRAEFADLGVLLHGVKIMFNSDDAPRLAKTEQSENSPPGSCNIDIDRSKCYSSFNFSLIWSLYDTTRSWPLFLLRSLSIFVLCFLYRYWQLCLDNHWSNVTYPTLNSYLPEVRAGSIEDWVYFDWNTNLHNVGL